MNVFIKVPGTEEGILEERARELEERADTSNIFKCKSVEEWIRKRDILLMNVNLCRDEAYQYRIMTGIEIIYV